MILRTNLSTRPFYNEGVVRGALLLAAVLLIGVSLFNAIRFMQLNTSQSLLGAHAVKAEQDAAQLRGEAATIRAQINPDELSTVAGAAREANGIIDQRAFSWTTLLTEFEHTLPDDVRIIAVQPRLNEVGGFVVDMSVQARRAEDLDAFIEALEKTGAFHQVTPRQERTNEDGLLEAIFEATYVSPETPRG